MLKNLFLKDYTFSKLNQVITLNSYTGIGIGTIMSTLNYYKISFNGDLISNIQTLNEKQQKSNLTFGKLTHANVDKKLLYLITTMRFRRNRQKYEFLKHIFSGCDEVQLKWVINIICYPKKLEGVLWQ